jgi:hypothetical protein
MSSNYHNEINAFMVAVKAKLGNEAEILQAVQ